LFAHGHFSFLVFPGNGRSLLSATFIRFFDAILLGEKGTAAGRNKSQTIKIWRLLRPRSGVYFQLFSFRNISNFISTDKIWLCMKRWRFLFTSFFLFV
jgi:hypothetical protein